MILRWRSTSGVLAFALAAALTATYSHAQSTAGASAQQSNRRAEPTTERTPPKEVAGIPVNYDEAKVGTYTLPDPLRFPDGKPVRSVKDWAKRRPQIVRLFEEDQYGRAPGRPSGMTFDVFDKGTRSLGGTHQG